MTRNIVTERPKRGLETRIYLALRNNFVLGRERQKSPRQNFCDKTEVWNFVFFVTPKEPSIGFLWNNVYGTPGREAVSLRTTPREGIKLTAKTVDEDPASCKRWISRKEIKSAKIKRTKNEKSKDYCKADLKQRVLFFIPIFRLAIPAFFRLQMLLNLCRNDNIIKTENVAIEIV